MLAIRGHHGKCMVVSLGPVCTVTQTSVHAAVCNLSGCHCVCCRLQVLEKCGLAGLTAAELNAGVLALRVSDLDAAALSPVLVALHNNTTVGERSRVSRFPGSSVNVVGQVHI